MDSSYRKVRIALIVLTQSYNKKSPLFLLKDNRVLFKDMEHDQNYTPNNAVSWILSTLGIEYSKEKGAENWVMPQLNNVFVGKDYQLVILYSCLVPESSKPDDETLQWKSITEILTDIENISEYDRKLISNFATGGE